MDMNIILNKNMLRRYRLEDDFCLQTREFFPLMYRKMKDKANMSMNEYNVFSSLN
jgi:hypothetical protein